MTVDELHYSMVRAQQHHADAYPAIVCAGDLAALARVALAARELDGAIEPIVAAESASELSDALATLFDKGEA